MFRVSCLGSWVSGAGFRTWDLGFRLSVSGLGFETRDPGFRYWGSRVSGAVFRDTFSVKLFQPRRICIVSSSGFQVSGFGLRDSGSRIRVLGFGTQFSGIRIRVSQFGFRNSGFGIRFVFGIRVLGETLHVTTFQTLWVCMAHMSSHTCFRAQR